MATVSANIPEATTATGKDIPIAVEDDPVVGHLVYSKRVLWMSDFED